MSILTPETTWRIHERAESALLIDGRDYYRAFYAAALTATKSILLLGWQFDSDVQLLRGEDLPEGTAEEHVQLLSVLERLSCARPELEIRILAWDHSVLFALERELLQKLYFDAISNERFVFHYDNSVPLGGSHHQKVAIIDGRVAFFGSQDICQARWDDSTHRLENEHRTSRGTIHQPYHEVQVMLLGEAARSMVDLFVWRWYGATGEHLEATNLIAHHDDDGGDDDKKTTLTTATTKATTSECALPITLPMPPATLGLARTIPEVIGREEVHEVIELYVRAINEAQRFIYIESQYLTACAVRDALLARMAEASRPKLDIIVMLPNKPERFKEEMTVGVPQAALLQVLHHAAKEHGHAFGVYNVVAGMQDDSEPLFVYIHSKLMIVDDRIFIVGSANLTNRSMTIDSELVAVYEASAGDHRVKNGIRRARVRLLMEHIGERAEVRKLVHPEGLVARLDALVGSGESRLRRHDIIDGEPSVFAKAVHDLTLEFLDPWDGNANGNGNGNGNGNENLNGNGKGSERGSSAQPL